VVAFEVARCSYFRAYRDQDHFSNMECLKHFINLPGGVKNREANGGESAHDGMAV
jgi:hypothetical protein